MAFHLRLSIGSSQCYTLYLAQSLRIWSIGASVPRASALRDRIVLTLRGIRVAVRGLAL